jgi:hypothetical protein
MLAAWSAVGLAQVNADSLRRSERAAVERSRISAASSGATFLDASRTAPDRLRAVEQAQALLDPEQIERGKRLVFDRNEPVAVRTRALQLVGAQVQLDTAFARGVASTALDSTAERSLRSEAVLQLARGSFDLPEHPAEVVEALRAGARDPDPEVRREAVRALARHADPVILRMLEGDLDSARSAVLPASEAAGLLGLVDPAPFYPLFRRLIREPPDSATRVVAIRLVASDPSSRALLASILQERRESPEARQAALGSLAAGDPQGLPGRVVPVVADENAPADLRLRAIKAVEISRTSRDPNVLGRPPDEFDRLLERLATSSRDQRVRSSSRTYLDRTRSAH